MAAGQYQTIEIEAGAPGVATLWLNRPDLRNAFNETMIAEITAACDVLAADASVRAVVLAGRGPGFCAGADLNWMKKMSGFSYEQNFADASALANMLNRLYNLPKPTLARVHGPAFAGGMGLVAVCDMAVASTAAKFCLSEVRIGLTPATISPYVLNALGERESRRYFLTAEVFDGTRARELGFVHDVVAPEQLDAAVSAMTAHLVQGSPAAMASVKELLNEVARGPIDGVLLESTARRIAAGRASDEGKEGIRSFLEKRPASWLLKK